MNARPLSIPGIVVLEPERLRDSRGLFAEVYNRRTFARHGVDMPVVQENQVFTARRGTVRGLHYQLPPYEQAKLVRCVRGAVFDVAVDLRADSTTFAKWVSAVLDEAGGRQIFIPAGFAHGYCSLSDDTIVIYAVSAFYAPTHEAGIAWDDPELAIDWPVPAAEAILSDKDRALPRLSEVRPIRLFAAPAS